MRRYQVVWCVDRWVGLATRGKFVTLASLFWTWGLIAAVCTAGCAIARLVGQGLDAAETERSRRQWKLMCEELDLEDLAARETMESAT